MPSILITGSNQGLGFEAVRHLAKDPQNTLYLCSRNETSGQEAVKKIKAEHADANVTLVVLDVTKDDSIAAAKAQVEKLSNGKGLDCLVNNAGIASVKDASPREEYNKIFDCNVAGLGLTTEAFLPLLKQSSHPRVVNVSSSLGSCEVGPTYNYCVAYSFSKGAVNNLTANFAKREPSVRFTAVCPGYNSTNLNGNPAHAQHPQEGSQIIAKTAAEKEGPSGVFINKDGKVPW